MKSKKIIVFAVSAILIFSSFFTENLQVFAADYEFNTVLNSDGTYTISGFKDSPQSGSLLDIVIPEIIDGHTVTAIGDSAFAGSTKSTDDGYRLIKSVTLPNTVKSIGNKSFYDCDGLSSINFPEGLETIGDEAFVHAGAIVCKFPQTLVSIGSGAFKLSKAKDLELNSGLKSIGSNAFQWCHSIRSFTVPDTVTSLGDNVIRSNAGLNTVRFPRNDSFDSIPENTFSADYDDNPNMGTLFGSMSIYIPENITYIPFDMLKNFKENSTVKIYGANGSKAYEFFKSVKTSLEAGTYTNKSGQKLADLKFVFYDFDTESEHIINDTLFSISINSDGETASVIGFNDGNINPTDDLSSIVIPSDISGYTVTDVADGSFKDETRIQSVIIPDTVTKIGDEAFSGASKLTNIKLSQNIKSLGEKCFANTSSLKNIDLPYGLETIGFQAFYSSGVTSVSIPDTVTYMGKGVFRLCTGLKYIKFSAGMTEIPSETFVSWKCVLEEIIIPESIVTISEDIIQDYGALNPTVYGVSGSEAENFAKNHNYTFVNVTANTVVSSRYMLGNGVKKLEGTDYDINYGFTSVYFNGYLTNIGKTTTNAVIYLALYSPDNTLQQINSIDVDISAGGFANINNESGLYIDNPTLSDGYTLKNFVWEKSHIIPIANADEIRFDSSKKEIHILSIGNSFCNDAFGYLKNICRDGNVVIKTQNMFIGGATVNQHYTNMLNDSAVYQPIINTEAQQGKMSISEALKSDKWDYVVLQAGTHGTSNSSEEDSDFMNYETNNVREKYEFIKEQVEKYAPDAKRIMHMSWTPGSDIVKNMYGGRFASADSPRSACFEAQRDAYLYAASVYSSEPYMIVPTAESIEYAIDKLGFPEWTKQDGAISENGRAMFRDATCHLNLPYGRMLAGLTWYEYLTGNFASDLNLKQTFSISESDMKLLAEAAHYACGLEAYNK